MKGEGNTVKIGENGKPLKGESELIPQQQSVVEKNKSKLNLLLDEIKAENFIKQYALYGILIKMPL